MQRDHIGLAVSIRGRMIGRLVFGLVLATLSTLNDTLNMQQLAPHAPSSSPNQMCTKEWPIAAEYGVLLMIIVDSCVTCLPTLP